MRYHLATSWAVVSLLLLASAGEHPGPATRPSGLRFKPGTPEAVADYVRAMTAAKAARLSQLPGEIEAWTADQQARAEGKINTRLRDPGGYRADRNEHTKAVRYTFRSEAMKRRMTGDAGQEIERRRTELVALRKPDGYPVVRWVKNEDLKVGAIGSVNFKIMQVVDGRNAIVHTTPSGDGKDIWLTDYPTAVKVDGDTDQQAIYVSGTKQFTTTLGAARTILLAQAIIPQEWVEQQK